MFLKLFYFCTGLKAIQREEEATKWRPEVIGGVTVKIRRRELNYETRILAPFKLEPRLSKIDLGAIPATKGKSSNCKITNWIPIYFFCKFWSALSWFTPTGQTFYYILSISKYQNAHMWTYCLNMFLYRIETMSLYLR